MIRVSVSDWNKLIDDICKWNRPHDIHALITMLEKDHGLLLTLSVPFNKREIHFVKGTGICNLYKLLDRYVNELKDNIIFRTKSTECMNAHNVRWRYVIGINRENKYFVSCQSTTDYKLFDYRTFKTLETAETYFNRDEDAY